MASNKDKYDCVVIGSGPGGAPFAWRLASKGMDVLILEAGPKYNPLTDYDLDKNDWELHGFPERKQIRVSYGKEQELDAKYSSLGSWNKALGKLNETGKRKYLKYQRVIGVGGSTLHYQGEAQRLNENAFKTKTLYGSGVDWPIDYKELEPYYSEVESVLGVAGPEKVPFRPRSKPFPLKAHKLSYASGILQKGCQELGFELEPNTLAILSEVYRDAPPCNYCCGCTWGCPRKDKGSVDVTFIPLCEDTGSCEVVTYAYVTGLETEKSNGSRKVKAVNYRDRSGKEHSVKADYVAVACGAVETPRLLLNSGIDSGGLVGKNFMETVFYEAVAFHPDRSDSYRGVPIDSIIWKWNSPDPERGFDGGLRLFATPASALGPVNYALRYFDGWGKEFTDQIDKWFGHAVGMGGLAEFIPNENTFVTVDPNTKDQFGMPVAKIQSFLGENELKSLDFMAGKIREILKSSGAEDIVEEVSAYDFFAATHVFGTCRMGKNPEDSVVDPSLRVHGIDNLLVTDASVFPTSGGGEAPSLTIEALSLRAADLLIKDNKKG